MAGDDTKRILAFHESISFFIWSRHADQNEEANLRRPGKPGRDRWCDRIVVSLVYVGRELRANTAAVKADSLQSITNSSSASMLAVVENGDFAEIRLQGDRDPTQLSEMEGLRYVLYQRQMWLHFQTVWTQWELGVIDDGVWAGYQNAICDDLVGTDAKLTWWNQVHAYALSDSFVDLIRNCH